MDLPFPKHCVYVVNLCSKKKKILLISWSTSPKRSFGVLNSSASRRWFQGTLCLAVLAVRVCCTTCLAQYFPFVFGVATANFSVVRLLGLSRFRREQRNPSHHQEGCGFGEQEYNFFWLTKIAGLSTESSKLLGISPVLITGSRDHHQPPSPSEPGKRMECNRARSWHVTRVLSAFLFSVGWDMSRISQLLSNSCMGDLSSSIHHWERIKLVLNFTTWKLSKNHLQFRCFAKQTLQSLWSLLKGPFSSYNNAEKCIFKGRKDSCRIPH